MALEGIGRFYARERSRNWITVPAKLVDDSMFRFVDEDDVRIRIENRGYRLVIDKVMPGEAGATAEGAKRGKSKT